MLVFRWRADDGVIFQWGVHALYYMRKIGLINSLIVLGKSGFLMVISGDILALCTGSINYGLDLWYIRLLKTNML